MSEDTSLHALGIGGLRRVWAERRTHVSSGPLSAPGEAFPLGEPQVRAVVLDAPAVRLGVRLHTFGSTTSGATVRWDSVEGDSRSFIAESHVFPVIDDVWIELTSTDRQLAGSHHEVTITATAGTVAAALDLEDGLVAWKADVATPVATHFEGDAIVVAESAADVRVVLELDWNKDGYVEDIRDEPFEAIVSDRGRYVPVQQLRRIDDWGFTVDGTRIAFAHADHGWAVNASEEISAQGDMSADRLRVSVSVPSDKRIAVSTDVTLEGETALLPSFTSSAPGVGEALTRLYRERALSWPFRDYTASPAGWKHWMTRVLSWTATDGSNAQAEDLRAAGQHPDGWIWTRTTSEGWPFPDPARFDTRHPSASLSFVSAVTTHAAWTGDEAFIAELAPRARRALDWVLTTHGVDDVGLLRSVIPDQDGRPGSLGSHYWDIVPGGGWDAYVNVLLVRALHDAASLEGHLGDHARSKQLTMLAERVTARFREVFWSDDAGRFVQNIDEDGAVHDYGSSYVNIEAMEAGLATAYQRERIIDWLDHGHVELTRRVSMNRPAAGIATIPGGGSIERDLIAPEPFRTLGIVLCSSDPQSAILVELRDGAGAVVASKTVQRWWDRGWLPLETTGLAAGAYRVRVTSLGSDIGWQRGEDDGECELAFALVSAHESTDEGIYDRWGFAPRSSSRRNDFWYTFGWAGVETEFGDQVQDGGTILYVSGPDIVARAGRDVDDAWTRLDAVLKRMRDPDRLCGGAPLYRGEKPQAVLPGAVGVDLPFPENGLVGTAPLTAFLGVTAKPGRLLIVPRLPRVLEDLTVRGVRFHGRTLEITAARDAIEVSVNGELHRVLGPAAVIIVEHGELIVRRADSSGNEAGERRDQ